MVLTIRLRGYKTETHRFVHECYLAEIALLVGREPARAIRFPGKALLGRWSGPRELALPMVESSLRQEKKAQAWSLRLN